MYLNIDTLIYGGSDADSGIQLASKLQYTGRRGLLGESERLGGHAPGGGGGGHDAGGEISESGSAEKTAIVTLMKEVCVGV